jgi:hypothetical protein
MYITVIYGSYTSIIRFSPPFRPLTRIYEKKAVNPSDLKQIMLTFDDGTDKQDPDVRGPLQWK